MGSLCVMAVGYRDEPSTHDRMRGRGGARPRHATLERPAAGGPRRRHPDHARWRPPRGDFGGLDLDILKSTLKKDQSAEDAATYKRYWADTPDARRRKLLPFFWRLVTEQGSIAGNPALGSDARLSNTLRFSYPGYAEILLGQAFDSTITSNDPVRNPHETVLERLRRDLKLTRAQVATIASWDVFTAIAERTEGATTINAGYAPLALDGADLGC